MKRLSALMIVLFSLPVAASEIIKTKMGDILVRVCDLTVDHPIQVNLFGVSDIPFDKIFTGTTVYQQFKGSMILYLYQSNELRSELQENLKYSDVLGEPLAYVSQLSQKDFERAFEVLARDCDYEVDLAVKFDNERQTEWGGHNYWLYSYDKNLSWFYDRDKTYEENRADYAAAVEALRKEAQEKANQYFEDLERKANAEEEKKKAILDGLRKPIVLESDRNDRTVRVDTTFVR